MLFRSEWDDRPWQQRRRLALSYRFMSRWDGKYELIHDRGGPQDVRKILEDHGGELHLEDVVEETSGETAGACVRMAFPLRQQGKANQGMTHEQQERVAGIA